MLAIVILNSVRRDDGIYFHILVPHRLHNHPFALHFFEFSKRVVLRLESLDEGVTIAVEILPDRILNALINVVIRNLEAFFFERLNDQLPIDQILESGGAGFFDFCEQLLTPELLAEQLFFGSGQVAHFRKGNDIGDVIAFDDGSDAINHFGFSRQCSATER